MNHAPLEGRDLKKRNIVILGWGGFGFLNGIGDGLWPLLKFILRVLVVPCSEVIENYSRRQVEVFLS